MLIDCFADDWLAALEARAGALETPDALYLLIDGAFVEGVHRMVPDKAKVCLFGLLPGADEQTMDVSPFLTQYSPSVHSLLECCNRWPMVSAIETPEPMERLAERLAAWCVVEVDQQRFHFRFADTRRLPTIYKSLHPAQRSSFSGPAKGWSYVARDGSWRSLPIDTRDVDIARKAGLDERQFSMLVEDGDADVMMATMSRGGLDVYRHPSRSHALVLSALQIARDESLSGTELAAWCEWFWKNDQLSGQAKVVPSVDTWRHQNLEA